MIKLLLCYFSMGTEKKLSCVPPHLAIKKFLQRLPILLTVLMGGQAYGQDLDTWFTADRAINMDPLPLGNVHLFTPYPVDGVLVSTWYDFIDFVPQDAIPHPDPANYALPFPDGFDYVYPNSGIYPQFLNPTGSIPGLPSLERNSMNFNPVVRFDGSGNGQALHFRPNSRQNVTVFVVFRALGAGNSAQTQRLLFGGDIEQHHWSSNSNQWLTNLSLGVSDGNRFSVGRTWFGDGGNGYFQNGSIDLLGKPAIGTFKRQAQVDAESLITHVNGIPDISAIRAEANADNDLFFFNRLGKHFNSNDANRNLTGDIAEVMLFDGSLPALETQIVESYLAIKYGLTLSNGPGLGSEVGNDNYNYLAADGSVIWQAENVYKYDIAGMGADRDEDQNAPVLKLRYNLHQRISKSENPEAIVTMSTNNNFSTDNLDNTRPEIDKNGLTSYLHNFMIWGNDRASLSATIVELPISGDITERISREWRVQAVRSPGVDPISNVSVRIDLSGSDILNNGDCGLKLLIDTDGDGDFTTGPITMIDVTSVDMAGNAYFDNVNFEHLDVFTVGFGDTEPPTASNPADITVCDTPPAADPLVVTDEADNCAIASVVLLSESSDGNTNPETITRTYRITDTTGNFVDVTQTIYVYLSPDIDDIADQAVCDSYTLPAITGNNLTGNQAYFSGSGGTGTQFAPGDNITVSGTYYIYDETGTSPNCFDEESFTVTVNSTPVAPIANNLAYCNTDSPTGADLVPAISATIRWYSDAGLSSIVAPADPLLSQDYYVTQTINGCEGPATTVTVTITDQPDAGTDDNLLLCTGNGASTDLQAILGGDPGGTWNDDDSSGVDLTNPDNVDLSGLSQGTYRFTYAIPATGGCAPDSATITVTITDQPDAGTDAPLGICQGDVTIYDLATLLAGTPDNGGTWTDVDDAFGNGANSPVPDPANMDFSALSAGAYRFTYAIPATGGCAPDSATITVTITDQPDAGTDDNLLLCTGNGASTDLQAILGGDPGGTWNDDDSSGVDLTNPDNVDLSGLSQGTYRFTYAFAATGGCAPDSATITVTITDQPDAGTDDNLLLCTGNGASTDLQAILAGDPGGTWNDDDSSGVDLTNPDNVDLSGLSQGTYRFTYAIPATGGCAPDAATITVTITDQPDAGTDDNLLLCTGNGASTDLQAILAGDPGGTWNDDDSSGVDLTNPDNVDLSGLSQGTYRFTYAIPATGGCAPDAATITVTVNTVPQIAVNTFSDPVACGGNGTIELTFSNVPDGNYDITYDAGVFPGVPVSGGSATINTPQGTYNNLRITVNGCTSTDNPDVTLTDPGAPTPNAGIDGNVCDIANPFATNANPAVGNGTWTNQTPGVGTATFVDPNDETTNVTVDSYGTYIFRWTDTNGSCFGFDEVTVTFFQDPTPANAGTDIAQCDDTDFTMAANIPIVGTGTWTQQSGPAVVIVDVNNPVTGVTGLPAGQSATLRWTIANGNCTPSFDEVTITNHELPSVASAGTDIQQCDSPDFTMAANAPAVGTGTWTRIAGPAVTIVSPNDPATNITGLPAGQSATLRWTIANGNCTPSFDEVTITNHEVPSVASAGTDIQQCDSPDFTMAANIPIVGTGTWTQTAGPAVVIVSPNDPATNITGLPAGQSATLRWTIANGNCTPSFDEVTITNDIQPVADAHEPDATTDFQVCGLTHDVDALATIGTGTWTQVAGPGNLTFGTNANDPDQTLTVDTYGTYTFRWTDVNGSCSGFDEVTVTFFQDPTPANAGTDIAQCDSPDFTMAANMPIVGTGTWTQTAGPPVTIADVNNPVTGVTGLPAGQSATLRWTIANGNCTPSLDEVTITNDIQLDAGTDDNLLLCTGNGANTDLQSILGGDPGGTWNDDDSSGVDLTNPDNVDLSGLSQGTYRFTYAIPAIGGCAPDSTTVTVTITDQPDVGTDAPLGICQGDVTIYDLATLLAGTPDNGGTWTDVDDAFGNGANSVVPDPANMDFSTLTSGTYRFTYAFAATGGCAPDNATITVTVNTVPQIAVNTFSDPVACGGNGTIELTFSNVPDGNYDITYDAGVFPGVPVSGGSVTINTPQGTYNNLRITVNGCTSTDNPDVTLTDPGAPTPNAGIDGNVCDIANPFATNANPAVGTGTWTNQTPGVGTATFVDPNDETTNVTVDSYGTYIFRWTDTNGSCFGFDEVTVTFFQDPTPANAGTDIQQCDSPDFTMAANAPAVGTGTWTRIAGPAVTIVSPNDPATNITGLPAGQSATLRWTIANGNCTPSLDEVTITNDIQPVADAHEPDATTDFQVCGLTHDVDALAAIGTGTWTQVAGPGNLSFGTNANDPDQTLTVDTYGTYTFRWTDVNGSCSGFDEVTVTFFQDPTPASAGTDIQQCDSPDFTMAANAPAVGTGTWTRIAGPAVTIVSPNDPATNITGLPAGQSATLMWTIANGNCTPSLDEVTITNHELPSVANAGTDIAQCDDTDFTMAANIPIVGTGTWTQTAGPAVVIVDVNNPVTGVTGLPAGQSATLRWTIANGNCTPSLDEVTITNHELPSVASAGTDIQQCDDTDFTMAANIPIVGTGTWTQTAGPAVVIVDVNNPVTDVTGLPAGQSATLRWTIANGNCTPSFDEVTITNDIQPVADAHEPDATTDFQVCGLTHDVDALAAIGTGTWTQVAGPGNLTFGTNANDPDQTLTVDTYGTYTFRWTDVNGSCSGFDEVTVTFFQDPTPANAGTDIQQCDSPDFTMAANMPIVGTGTWTQTAGPAVVIVDVNNPVTGVTGLPAGQSATLRWTIANGNCTPSLDEVTITNHELPSVASAGTDIQQCDSPDFTMAANMPIVGTGTWTQTAGPAVVIVDVNNPVTSVTGLPAGQSATLRWTIANGNCTPSLDEVTITNHELPSVANAGTDIAQCDSPDFTMAANIPIVGTGTWTQTAGPAVVIVSPNDPATNITGLPAGQSATLRWTIANGNCTPSFDEVTITNDIQPVASAGPDEQICGATDYLIAGASATGFDSLTWTHNGNGTFIDPSVQNPIYRPHSSDIGSTVTLTMTASSSGICGQDIDSMDLVITKQPDAGSNGAITICEGEVLTQADLFALLGGTPDLGGTWSPAFSGAGVYTYTVTATAPCATDATATVTVSEQQRPDAGSNGSTTICEGEVLTQADLFALLGGTPDLGGTWSPAFSGPGVYTYTVTATAPCATDATATVTVSEQQRPDAGSNGSTTICEGEVLTQADLFALLGGTPDLGGTWSPAFSGAGVYTYTVTATAPCATDATATVTVSEQQQPDAGSNGSTTICEGEVLTQADLFALLGGTPDLGGTWSPAFSGPGVYTYTVTATAPCATDATATVTVSEQQQPDAGSNGSTTICEGEVLTQADLFALLGGSPDLGGTWSPAFSGAGVYTYTVTATAPCATDATATVTVSEQQQPDAGSNGSTTICEGDALTQADLFALLGGTPDLGGTWSPAFNGAGVYTYTVTATAPCATDATATVTVSEQQRPDAGSNGSTTICEGEVLTQADLFALLGGTPDLGGTWSPAFSGAGVYTYTVTATAPCATDATATVTVSEQQRPDAGIDATLYICDGDTISAEDLFNALGGTPDIGGNWNPVPDGVGIYTYTIAANGSCLSSSTAQVTVIEENLGASVEPVYLCDGSNLPSNSIEVSFVDPSANNDLMYALDSSDPNDFMLSPDFINISAGEHSLFIMRSNGCVFEYPFTIDDIEPLELELLNDHVNGITANVTGGSGPYTYYFDNQNGTSSNTYTINRNGTFMVTVVDDNGCEVTASISMNFVDITIPDFFTPNDDGKNDFWGPKNTEAFPNIQTFIFDRYGRKIQILGQFDVWKGYYDSKPLPSGDYWYIVKLNDESGREFVGHFTLFR